jgi:hypothetical protein
MLLAFDEYHDDAGRPIGMAEKGQKFGSDLYTSNYLVRAMCRARPDRYLFAGSVHPYRADALGALEELAASGVKLIKWLPIHQNIDAADERTTAFLRRAAELRVPLLIHYGGEMSLSRQHMEFESPVPLLRVLRSLRTSGAMPTVIVALSGRADRRIQRRPTVRRHLGAGGLRPNALAATAGQAKRAASQAGLGQRFSHPRAGRVLLDEPAPRRAEANRLAAILD